MSNAVNRFPPGRDEERVRDLIEHYDGQTDDELAAEIEAAPTLGELLCAIPRDGREFDRIPLSPRSLDL